MPIALPSWNSIKNSPFPKSKCSSGFVNKVLLQMDKYAMVTEILITTSISLFALNPLVTAAIVASPAGATLLTLLAILMIALAIITIYNQREAFCKLFLKLYMAL
ncbi:MAG: hypothetical protein HY820_19225 [Acidobacteria bacterium]|nr:hypothetical protein [Acidobacteriota bacterium]